MSLQDTGLSATRTLPKSVWKVSRLVLEKGGGREGA